MATTFSSLPVEIQRQCVNYLDITALRSMRLSSQAIRDVTTEALFEVATLQVTEESAERFSALMNNDESRRYICRLLLDTHCAGQCAHEECDVFPPPEWWAGAVARWSCVSWPNLKKITVDCAYACANRRCASLGLAFTTFLAGADIEALTIKHLHDSCLIQRPDFTPGRAKVTKLHLLLTTWSDDASPDNDIEIRYRHSLFNIHLNTTWLTPLQTQLTHLTLHSNTYWGVYPPWQPGDLHFPRLRSLALGKWTIAFDWQIDFIVSHSDTLQELFLTNCPILHALRMTPRQSDNQWRRPRAGTARGKPPTNNFFSGLRWHTVLLAFKSKLPKLKYFSMGPGPLGGLVFDRRDFRDDEAFEDRYKLSPRIDSARYAVFDFGAGPAEWLDGDSEYRQRWHRGKGGFDGTDWVEKEMDEEVRKKANYPDCLQEDQAALEGLLRSLRERW
ncbi:hypothetical protein BU25DRAFT_458036 [Macroventuria anomochaeta]|uniref:Uncharacterized protein n=1 Tax=Macroventuria anomochaeta TaxID=301207 RepID=A0ACB6S2J3_9PLEO|nr:uncharacterized protein BU25DRAFT_458036 [Macroventuria anomochaeta]KAF2628187.1 hypothetical protein BU25DRAFT_458036 [Macroventuria anomochaeta]